jgi:hypothetical protein
MIPDFMQKLVLQIWHCWIFSHFHLLNIFRIKSGKICSERIFLPPPEKWAKTFEYCAYWSRFISMETARGMETTSRWARNWAAGDSQPQNIRKKKKKKFLMFRVRFSEYLLCARFSPKKICSWAKIADWNGELQGFIHSFRHTPR